MLQSKFLNQCCRKMCRMLFDLSIVDALLGVTVGIAPQITSVIVVDRGVWRLGVK